MTQFTQIFITLSITKSVLWIPLNAPERNQNLLAQDAGLEQRLQGRRTRAGQGGARQGGGSLSVVAPPMLVPLLPQSRLGAALSESRRPIRARSTPCRPSSLAARRAGKASGGGA
jgi:hypothetical protein